jgi:hypothetical protein
MLKKSVISLIAYDAHMLPSSIKSYYPYVDEIVLGLDKDRVSWSGNKFSFDENKLWKELKNIDIKNKIHIVEEDFHGSKVPIENDNFERNYLKSSCTNDLILSFDADEILVNSKEFFIDFLPLCERYYVSSELVFTWFLPYKKLKMKNPHTNELLDHTLMIANNDGTFFRGDQQGFACSKDSTFTYCRWTDKKRKILTNLAIMHYSFCRPDKEVEMKINNYGHSADKNDDPFLHNWRLVDEKNYSQLRNFKTHQYGGGQWEKLLPVPDQVLMDVAKEQAAMII